MKKHMLSFLLVLTISVLCLGCGKDEEATQPEQNTEPVVEDVQQEEETDIEAEESRRTKVEDPEIVANINALMDAEKMFRAELDTKWSEYEGTVEINDLPYRLVDTAVAASWADYEKRAKDFYTEDYIKEEFTPFYTVETKTFVEEDGKLYRAESDGVVLSIMKDTIEIFESVEDRLLVTYFVDAGGEEIERALLIEKSENSPYGYVIVERIEYVK